MIKFEDFKDENGNTDWKAYHKAQEEIGERCYKCGDFTFPGKGYMSLCYDCQNLRDNHEEVNSKSIRCPNCQTVFDPREYEMYDLYNDGEHDVQCPNCDKEFEITTEVEYSFTSPALLNEEEED